MPPAAAIAGGAIIGGGLSLFGASKAAKGAERAAATQAQAQVSGAETAAQSQREALQYLKQREAIPQHLREQALQRLGGIYGIQYSPGQTSVQPQTIQQQPIQPTIAQQPVSSAQPQELSPVQQQLAQNPFFSAIMEEPTQATIPAPSDQVVSQPPQAVQTAGTGTPFGQQDLIQQAMESPLYGAMMGGREAGEEAIMRRAAATGGLRSGNVQGAMYDYNTRLQNQALLQSYNEQLQGLLGLAGLPSYAPQIASGMAGVGQTLGAGITGAGTSRAQGQVASGQAWQQGMQNIGDIALGGLGTYIDITRPKGPNI